MASTALRMGLLATALLSFQCGRVEYAAALTLTIEGGDLGEGGGYQIEFRRPDGVRIPGTLGKFVPYSSGDQRVTLVLDDSTHFESRDTLAVRVHVEARPAPDAAATAMGTAIITLERQGVVEHTLLLAGPPGIDGNAFFAHFTDDGVGSEHVHFIWPEPRTAVGVDYHAWAMLGSKPVWLAALSPDQERVSVSFSSSLVTSLLTQPDVRWQISAEPAANGNTSTLVRPNGWMVAAGEWTAGQDATYLQQYDETLSGPVADLFAIIGIAVQHSGLAVAGNAILHAEHVVNALLPVSEHVDFGGGGQDPASGTLGDLGVAQYLASMHAYANDSTVQEATGGSGSVLQRAAMANHIATCANNLEAALAPIFAAAERTRTEVPTLDAAEALLSASEALTGLGYDSSGDSTTQRARCVRERVQAFSVFELAPI